MSVDLGDNFLVDQSKLQQYIEDEFVNKRKSPVLIPHVNPRSKDKFLPLNVVEQNLTQRAKEHFDIVIATIPDNYPPTSLEDFNYFYNDKGELRNKLKPEEAFHFVSQRHYEAIGDFIVRDIQLRMINECGLQEVWLPEDNQTAQLDSLKVTAMDQQKLIKSNIFLSPDALTADKLMLLIQGSGAVRAGQWARALCMNESLTTGSQLDYIKQAQQEGYGVIVFNPNLNKIPRVDVPDQYTKKGFFMTDKPTPLASNDYQRIPEHDSPPQHTITVWDQFVAKSAAKHIAIVAHSAGGYCTMRLLEARHPEALKRLRGIAFTDSVHSVSSSDPRPVQEFIVKNAINWVTSDRKLDTLERPASRYNCECRSAGHTKHENTSASCITSAFKFLADKVASASS
jgi:hypothetical protein